MRIFQLELEKFETHCNISFLISGLDSAPYELAERLALLGSSDYNNPICVSLSVIRCNAFDGIIRDLFALSKLPELTPFLTLKLIKVVEALYCLTTHDGLVWGNLG
jgi:hypothetical protein